MTYAPNNPKPYNSARPKNDFRTVSPGKYVAFAKQAEYKILNTKDGRQVEVVEVHFITDEGKKLRWTGWFGGDETKDARNKEALKLCGWSGDDLRNLSGVHSRRVQLVVEDKSRTNQYGENVQFSNVKYVNEWHPPRHEQQPSPSDAQRYSAVVQQLDNVARTPAPARAQLSFADVHTEDDDIPF